QVVVLALQPMVLHSHLLALDVASSVKALAERSGTARIRRTAVDEADHRHRRLLRPRRERPRGYRAAEQHDELAAVHCCNHSITSSARASSVGGILSPSAVAVLQL